MRRLICALFLLSAACRIGEVEPLPIAGPVPGVVAVWPVAIGGDPPGADVWFAGLSSALGRRGYRVLTPGLTRELLKSYELTEDLAKFGPALRADAVMQLEIREFDADGTSAVQHANWDLSWRLISTRGFGEQWSFRHQGYYSQAARYQVDPGRSFDEHSDPPIIVPIGGLGPRGFRTPAELLASLHNQAMERLPKL